MEAFKLEQFIKCPHCSSEVSYELDDCPECSNALYDFDVQLEKEDVFIQDYLEFVSVPVEPKGHYKVSIFISFFAVVISIIWALNIIISFQGNIKIPEGAFILFFSGIAVIAFTEFLIWRQRKKFNLQIHRSDYHF